MAYKIDNYIILASYQYYDREGFIHIYVAIESSAGRFKVYVDKQNFDPEQLRMNEIVKVARIGGKVGGETAKKLFPIVAQSYTYEG